MKIQKSKFNKFNSYFILHVKYEFGIVLVRFLQVLQVVTKLIYTLEEISGLATRMGLELHICYPHIYILTKRRGSG